jgi:FkbM family methyltransferase
MGSLINAARRARSWIKQLVGLDLPHRLQVRLGRTLLLGNLDADWCICPDGLGPRSVLYSFGVGEEISFDLAMIERFGLTVHAFDPTPRSVEWLQRQRLPGRFLFHPYGLAKVNGELKLYTPENPRHVSYSVVPEPGWTSNPIAMPVHRLDTVAEMLGHRKLDILKMDIEGAEYEVIEDLARSKVEVSQLLVEFHHIHKKRVTKQATAKAIRQLNELGYRVFYISVSGAEYSFIRQ